MTKKVKNGVEIIVIDSGRGISTEILQKITLKQPVDVPERKEGHGYGLMLSGFIIDQYSGKLEVKSTIPYGAKISMWFPLVKKTT